MGAFTGGLVRIGTSITISGLSFLYGDDLAAVIETGRIADAAGVDQIVMTDHVAIGPRTDRYPYGPFPFPPEEPWLEPLSTLAALAGTTSRIRLGTGILIVPLRPPLLLAKTLATLDVLSKGRLDVGVGSGWQPEEFAGSGAPFRGRSAHMDDTLRACRALWRDSPASFESETVSFDSLWCEPRPLQPGGIPIWLGGAASERNAARIAEYGVGWMPMEEGLSPKLRAGIARLRRAFEAVGRDPATLQVRAGVPVRRSAEGRIDLDATLDQLPEMAREGVTMASLALARFVRRRGEIERFLQRVGEASRPKS